MESIKKRKKRILYVITKSNMGGAQRYVYDLAKSMSDGGYDVSVAFGGSGTLKSKLEQKGIPTYEIKSFERDINLIKEIFSMFELRSVMKELEPDIVHLNSSKAGGSGALVARAMKIPRIVFTAHGWPFYEKRNIVWRTLTWFFSYLTVLLSHKTIVVSKHDYDKHMMPLLNKKIVHINTAIPKILFKDRESSRLELFSEEVIEKNKNNLWAVSTGEFIQNKNLLKLLHILKKHNESSDQKIFLTLIGEGEETGKLQKFVENNNLSNYVSFLGQVENAREYLKAFDVFVMPSLKEGLPYGLLEAGAAGLYCIASKVGGIPDVIKHEKTGVLVNPTNEDLLYAFKNIPYNSKDTGDILKKEIESNFSLEDMVERTKENYTIIS